MDDIMKKPHKFVLEDVQRKWTFRHSKGFWSRLLELGEIKPVAIEIVQTESWNERSKLCTGNTLNRWRYDNTGLHLLSTSADTGEWKLEYCYYCIDEKRKKLVIVWANILPMASRRKKIHYFHTGVVCEIIKYEGGEDYRLISTWIE